MELSYTVEEWKNGSRVETVGTLTNGLVAKAAFKALVELRPRSHLMLRQGTRLIEQWEPPPAGVQS